jgi:hypothetical protein
MGKSERVEGEEDGFETKGLHPWLECELDRPMTESCSRSTDSTGRVELSQTNDSRTRVTIEQVCRTLFVRFLHDS